MIFHEKLARRIKFDFPNRIFRFLVECAQERVQFGSVKLIVREHFFKVKTGSPTAWSRNSISIPVFLLRHHFTRSSQHQNRTIERNFQESEYEMFKYILVRKRCRISQLGSLARQTGIEWFDGWIAQRRKAALKKEKRYNIIMII